MYYFFCHYYWFTCRNSNCKVLLCVFITAEVLKKLLKITQNKKQKHKEIFMLARSKLNSIESAISRALIDNENSHEDFTTIINEERNCRELKESIRMMKSQRSDIDA